jgi:L-ribulose-5-phosphate 3-epimerase
MSQNFSQTGNMVSRREFIGHLARACSGMMLARTEPLLAEAGMRTAPPIVVFSKVFQELKLSFEEAANLTAEAGLAGIDCPLRPGGEVLPERAGEDLPRYAEMLREHSLQIALLTTNITSVSTPYAESVLRMAKQLGIHFYRFGFIEHRPEISPTNQMRQIKAQLAELAALNRHLGMCGLLQNHSPSENTVYFAGNLEELRLAVEEFDPAQIGVAFDIGHALVVHGDDWRKHFDRLTPHFKIAYVKDVKRSGRWVPFGQGDIAATGYFELLKQMGYSSPVSMHMEYDWSAQGKNKTRASLTSALKNSAGVLRQWLA